MNKLKLLITGKTKKYFLNEIIKNKINIYDLKELNNNYEIVISEKDYKNLLNIRTTSKIKIINRIGLNKYLFILKNNLIITIFILIGILLNIFLSNIVFSIEIDHPNKNLKNIIIKDLDDLGIKKYKLKKSYLEKEKIKEQILTKEKNKINWIEIEEIGTKYKIQIEEKKFNNIQNCNPRNIISNKKAIITKITSSTGEIIKKINDYVIPGDILISGIIYNKETAVNKICATGSVYGETWYKIKVILNKKYQEEKLTTNKSLGFKINFFSFNKIFFNKFSKYKITEYNIIESKIIPLKIGLILTQEIKSNTKINTLDKIDKKALSIAEKRILKDLDLDERVLSKKVLKKSIKNSKIVVDVFISTEENITAYEDITNIDINELNKE